MTSPVRVLAFCAAAHPLDSSILCGLPEGHDGIHEAREYHGGRLDGAA